MPVMTFDKFISSQFENKSKMDYKLNFSRPDESKEQEVENHSKKQAQRGLAYFNNIDFGLSRKGTPPLTTSVESYIASYYPTVYINFFDFPKVIVNPEIYNWYLNKEGVSEEMSFNIFLKIITEGEDNQNDKFIKALNEEAGVPTKSVGGGPISTQFYESIDKQLKKGVSIEEIDVLNLIREVGDMNLLHKLSSIAFKRSRFKEWGGDGYTAWDDMEINDSWTDNHHWSLYHNNWWFPPNLFVLNVDEIVKYKFINWIGKHPLEVKE
jgi:hypothetical protein